MSTIELTSKVRQIKELQQLIDEATTEAESLKDEIKAHIASQKGYEENQPYEMTIDVFKVRWTPVKSNRFDSTAFKTTHKELYGQYCKETTSKRFSII